MQAPTVKDSPSPSHVCSTHPPPLAHNLPGCNTPHDIDSALGHASSGCTHSTAQRARGAGSLPGADSSDDIFSGITDLGWDHGYSARDTPQDIFEFAPLDEFSLDTNYLDLPPASPLGDWAPGLHLDIGNYEPVPLSDWSTASPLFLSTSSSQETADNGSETPAWYCESPRSAYTAEPTSPSSLPSMASVSALERGRRGSSASRGSRPTSRSRIRSTASDPYKRRIDPLRHPRTSSKDSSDLAQCDTCEHTFRYKKDLERHKSSVHVRRTSWFCPVHECKFATQGFSRKDKAFQHVRTHRRNSEAGLEPIFAADQSSAEAREEPLRSRHTVDSPRVTSSTSNPPSNRTSLIIDATRSSQSQRGGQVIKPHACSVAGCDTVFVHEHDLRRHLRTLHQQGDAVAAYRCASGSCRRADKIWPRLDSFRQHVLRRHSDEDADMLIRRSTRSLHESQDRFPITIATPQTFGRTSRPERSVPVIVNVGRDRQVTISQVRRREQAEFSLEIER